MAISQQPSRFVYHWLFWVECAFLVGCTGFMDIYVMGGVPALSLVGDLYLIGWFIPPLILGFGTVLWLAARSQQIKKSFQVGILLLFTSEMLAVVVGALLHWLYLTVYLDCHIQCGNETLTATFFFALPIICCLGWLRRVWPVSSRGWFSVCGVRIIRFEAEHDKCGRPAHPAHPHFSCSRLQPVFLGQPEP